LQLGVPYRLFNYTGTLTENAPFSVPNVNGYTFTVDTSTVGQVKLVASGGPPVWNGGSGSGSLWSDAANWNGIAIQPNSFLYFAGNNRLNNTNDTTADTAYGDIVFTADAGAFVLNGNSVTLSGNVVNDSPNTETINLGLSFGANRTLDGGTGVLAIGGGLTNTANLTTLTLDGVGVLTNILGTASGAETNMVLLNNSNANWTLRDNSTAAAMTVPWAFAVNSGTFNFGSGSSAPTLTSTSPQGVPQDNQIGSVANATGTLNIFNGTFTTTARVNTGGAGNANGVINQSGGTFNIGSQFQGANSANTSASAVNASGGTMNVGGTGGGGPFYVASRGTGVVAVTSSGFINCGVLDVSRNANGGTGGSQGTVNLNGGTLACTRVGTATANSQAGPPSTGILPTATFNFNGGTLRAKASSTTFFQGSTVAPIIPITAIVKAGGAIIDTAGFNISVLEALQHDSALGGTADGGLKKLGAGTLTLTVTNTYTGPTVISNGTLLVNGVIGATAVSVESGGALGGTGTISNSVTVKSGGTITAGAAGATGNLTVAGNVTMQAGATNFMELSKTAATNDQIRAIAGTPTTITYAGTLSLTNLAGTLVGGESFKLFTASNYAGAFSAIVPATPGAGLKWVTNALATSGTITVGIVPIPRMTTFSMVGGNIVIGGTNGPAGNTYVVLTSTNIEVPLSNWTTLITSNFDGSGNFNFNAGAATAPRRFYVLQVP
jgi:autotransporter-associated beta strand protein